MCLQFTHYVWSYTSCHELFLWYILTFSFQLKKIYTDDASWSWSSPSLSSSFLADVDEIGIFCKITFACSLAAASTWYSLYYRFHIVILLLWYCFDIIVIQFEKFRIFMIFWIFRTFRISRIFRTGKNWPLPLGDPFRLQWKLDGRCDSLAPWFWVERMYLN